MTTSKTQSTRRHEQFDLGEVGQEENMQHLDSAKLKSKKSWMFLAFACILVIVIMGIIVHKVFWADKQENAMKKSAFADECSGLGELKTGPMKVGRELKVTFNRAINEDERNDFETKYLHEIKFNGYSSAFNLSIGEVFFSSGTDGEWSCRLKKDPIVTSAEYNVKQVPQ